MKKKIEFIIEDFNNGLSEEEILEKYKIKKSTLQTYLSQARKRGIEVKTREKAKPKYIPVAEDWNNGLPEEEILEKYNIVKKILQSYLSQARKRGIEVKTREKAKPKYVQIVEDWNNGLPEDEILVKYNMVKQNLQNYLNRARKRGIEVKAREKAKSKNLKIVEDWNNGLSEEEILKKYNIKKITLQTYLSQARKRGIEVKAREKAKPKYMQVAEDWNNGLSEEEILVKYNIVKKKLHKYLNRARRKGLEVKVKLKYIQVAKDLDKGLTKEEIMEKYQITPLAFSSLVRKAKKHGVLVVEKTKPKYMQVAEDLDKGLTKEEIMEKYKITPAAFSSLVRKARKNGILIAKKATPKYMQVVEDWNSGLPEEEILVKYKIKSNTFNNYLRLAQKERIEVKTREKAKPKYMKVAEDWNNGLSEEEILKKYNIIKSTLQTYLSRAKKERIEVKARKKVKPKYMEVTENWNNGLSEEEILKKYNIKKITLQSYLSQARKRGIEVKAREKAKPEYMQVAEDWNNGLSEEKIIFQKDQKRSREKIKESLKLYLPRQVAKRLKISTKTVFDVMDSLNSEERKEVNKAFIRNRPYVFSRVKKLKKDGKSVLEALKSIESNIPLQFLSQLQEVYYNLGLYSYIEKSINKRLYLDETISGKEKEYLKGLKETMHLEVISVQIRKKQKEALKNEKSISYDRLCKDFNVRTNFLVDLLGREEKDY